MKQSIIAFLAIAFIFTLPSGSAPAEDEVKSETKVTEISAAELWKRLKGEWVDDSRPVLIDLRTPKEHAEGRLADARRIDFPGNDFEAKIAELDRNRTYVIYCLDGTESAKSLETWKRLDFRNLYHLEGGWKAFKAEISGGG